MITLWRLQLPKSNREIAAFLYCLSSYTVMRLILIAPPCA